MTEQFDQGQIYRIKVKSLGVIWLRDFDTKTDVVNMITTPTEIEVSLRNQPKNCGHLPSVKC